MGEAELGRIDIPTCDESVKKSFQTLHGLRPRGCIALVVELFALLVVAGRYPNHFPANAHSERKKDHPADEWLDRSLDVVTPTIVRQNL